MTVFTASQVQSDMAKVLNDARRQGAVEIRGEEGDVYVLRAVSPTVPCSPLDVPRTKLAISTEEIVRTIREERERPRSW
ncbi:MAG: hypothetical protein WD768_15910 [Phycisphaeraceae bacterium]